MPELTFDGFATWKSGTECELSARGKQIISVSPPPLFGGKEGYCTPEDIFAVALASCVNTLFLLIAKNSQLELKNLETKATVKMNIEGMEKLIFTHVHFKMDITLKNDNEHERKKAETVYDMAQKICPIRQSWGEAVPLSFELNFNQ
jgi:organic hydroperoxide reductase OsmC/OhrA